MEGLSGLGGTGFGLFGVPVVSILSSTLDGAGGGRAAGEASGLFLAAGGLPGDLPGLAGELVMAGERGLMGERPGLFLGGLPGERRGLLFILIFDEDEGSGRGGGSFKAAFVLIMSGVAGGEACGGASLLVTMGGEAGSSVLGLIGNLGSVNIGVVGVGGGGAFGSGSFPWPIT